MPVTGLLHPWSLRSAAARSARTLQPTGAPLPSPGPQGGRTDHPPTPQPQEQPHAHQPPDPGGRRAGRAAPVRPRPRPAGGPARPATKTSLLSFSDGRSSDPVRVEPMKPFLRTPTWGNATPPSTTSLENPVNGSGKGSVQENELSSATAWYGSSGPPSRRRWAPRAAKSAASSATWTHRTWSDANCCPIVSPGSQVRASATGSSVAQPPRTARRRSALPIGLKRPDLRHRSPWRSWCSLLCRAVAEGQSSELVIAPAVDGDQPRAGRSIAHSAPPRPTLGRARPSAAPCRHRCRARGPWSVRSSVGLGTWGQDLGETWGRPGGGRDMGGTWGQMPTPYTVSFQAWGPRHRTGHGGHGGHGVRYLYPTP